MHHSLLQEKEFNRAQTHRWHSGKYFYWGVIFLSLHCDKNEMEGYE